MSRTALLILASLAVGLLPAASAFSSLPPGTSPHEDITASGAKAAGFPTDGIAALQAAVVAPDFHEMEWDPDTGDLARVDADGSYRAEHHCDRIPPAGDAESFNATVAYIQAQAAQAVRAAQAGDAEEAIAALGRALHAAQDCSSHTDAVDRGIEAEFPAMVLGVHAPPAGLRLTGFEPGADDPEGPEGDAYPHKQFNKDAPDEPEGSERLPDNRTKHEVARGMAQETTRQLVAAALAELDPAQVERLSRVGAGDRIPDVDVPTLPAWSVALALVAVAAAWTSRHR